MLDGKFSQKQINVMVGKFSKINKLDVPNKAVMAGKSFLDLINVQHVY